MSVKSSRGDSYENPTPGHTYISPSLPAFSDPSRKVRIATKAIDTEEAFAFAEVKGELVLRHKEGGRNCITAKFFEDDRGVYLLSIQGYTAATMKPHNASFSFRGEEIGRLVEFVNHVQSMPLKHPRGMRIADEELHRLVLTKLQAANLVRDNEDLFKEVVRQALTKEDLVAIGYRKRQLQAFERLLKDAQYFEQTKARLNCNAEALWQRFFEKNPWIFGYGLLVRRERYVVRVARVRAARCTRQGDESHIQNAGDQIRNDRRARTALRQSVICARDLSDRRGDGVVKGEVGVLDEEATNAAEVNRREKVLEVDVERPPTVSMLSRVRDDRFLALEAVCGPVLSLGGQIDLVDAVLQEIREATLQ